MTTGLKGILAMFSACTVWGLSGLYYKLLAHVPPLEVLAHRTVWSLVFFGIVVMMTGRWARVREAFGSRRTVIALMITALTISINWFGYIYSIQIGHAMEASLGYYIFPLVAVGLGFVVFRERFRLMQAVAIGFAAVAVLVLTIGLGAAPWMALLLACSFGVYGLIKKQLSVGPITGVFIEVALLAPIALIWLYGVHFQGWSGIAGRPGGFFGTNWHDTVLLMASGPLTALPLMAFSYAATRLTYATIGLVQYINPTLQFVVAVFAFGEPFTFAHGLAFPLIWAGLALYSLEALRHERRARKAPIA